MALKRNMTGSEMVAFIDNELLPQTKLEIENWIKPQKRQGGYFVTVRQIFCMVDFLGAVFSGYHLAERKRDRKGQRIATSHKAVKFVTTFFSPKSEYTLNTVTRLYDMYRNGLVHLYQPKILKLNYNARLQWFFYKGNRHKDKIEVDSDRGKITFRNINHLQIISNDPKRKKYYLPISIDCLYDDFEAAVQRYRDKLNTTKYLQRSWRTTVNAICKTR